jgi:hypothetical protein
MLGVYDDADVPDLAADFYRGKAKGRYLKWSKSLFDYTIDKLI